MSDKKVNTSSDERSSQKPETRRLNALWMLIGIAIYACILSIGQAAIMHGMITSNPERNARVEQVQNTSEELSEEVKAENLKLFMPVIIAGIALVLLAPLLVGGVMGFYTNGLREAAITLGVASLLAVVLGGASEEFWKVLAGAVVAAALNVGLAIAGAHGGRLLGRKIRGER